MRPKIQNHNKFRSKSEETASAKQGKTKLCQMCEKDPKQVILSLRKRTRRRRIYSGPYTVIQLGEDHGKILKVCRRCFFLGKHLRFLRPARPPGAARKGLEAKRRSQTRQSGLRGKRKGQGAA